MEKTDVLIGDIRVTALADEGSYSFEWEDEDKKLISLADDCRFTEVPPYVQEVIEANDLRVVDSDLAEDTDEQDSTQDTVNNQSSNTGLLDDNTNGGLLTNPDDSTESGEDKSDISMVEEQNQTHVDNQETEQEEKMNRVSFIVRMSDPDEREEIVEKLMDLNTDAAKKLQLTGPYKVTYDVSGSNITLVDVEDLGIGSSVN